MIWWDMAPSSFSDAALPAEPEPVGQAQTAPEALRYAVVLVQTHLTRKVAIYEDDGVDAEGEEPNLARVFHYSVPEHLREAVRLGQLVWVPFGARYLQGIIIAFSAESPVESTRDIDQIADPEPVLSSQLIDLAHWISAYYLAPLHQVVAAMLPPGIIQEAQVVLSANPAADLSEASEAQKELYAQLVEHGPLPWKQIVQRYARSNWRSIANQLLELDWASKSFQVLPPKVKPKLIPVVRVLAQPPEGVPLRSAKQKRIMEYLEARATAGDAWVPLSQVADDLQVTTAAVRALAKKGLVEVGERQIWRDPLEGRSFMPVIPPQLTHDQEAVWNAIAQDLDKPGGRPFLLQGVTGSGKTEIYLRAVQRVLARGQSAIVLVPEIALTPQTIRRFGARFPTTMAVIHSHLSLGERYDQWRRLRSGELRLVIGSRSALFAPVCNLGLIVIDEEHEWSYKQERTPRYHAREVAVQLAKRAVATCLLGSATPDVESTYRAQRGIYVSLVMPQRIMGHRGAIQEQSARLSRAQQRYRHIDQDPDEAMHTELPPVEVVDMRAELRAGNKSIFSRSLQRAIQVALAAHEQIILFLNRRGTATFVMCRDCGHVLECPRCDVPLTYHSAVDDLICHHCSYTTFVPPQCPSCWSGRIKFFGTGTERVEQLVREAYPQARVVRWDLDTTGGKLAHEKILDQFINGEADIMVGTQMIAKGLDLPQVTLVGVITADTMLHLPDFRASERTFQLLTQVAGRAGRSILGGKVIIQTYTPQHPAIQAASKHDYNGFAARELEFRREHWYPPFSKLIWLEYAASNADSARREAERMHRQLLLKIARLGLPELELIGPAPNFFQKLRGKWYWHILVRGKDPASLLRDVHLPLGWRVDVDPVSVL